MKNNLSILIVDDDIDDRDIFISAVKKIDAHIECITAKDGWHAIELLQNTALPLPDFIFLDLRMPRFSGKKCLMEIKKDERLKLIPVIIYTTSKEVSESIDLKKLGAVYFISKPSNPDELYYLISSAMEEQWADLRKTRSYE